MQLKIYSCHHTHLIHLRHFCLVALLCSLPFEALTPMRSAKSTDKGFFKSEIQLAKKEKREQKFAGDAQCLGQHCGSKGIIVLFILAVLLLRQNLLLVLVQRSQLQCLASEGARE